MSTQQRFDDASKLTPRQARFVSEYLIDLNATQAAIRAGFSAKAANRQASRLLANVRVRAEVEAGKARQLEKAELSASRVLEELRRLAFVDLRGFYDARGNLKPMSQLTAEQGAALAGVETMQRNLTAGDGETDTVHKIKTYDKTRALDMLARHFKLLTDVVEVSDAEGQIAKLLAGRKRAAERARKGA